MNPGLPKDNVRSRISICLRPFPDHREKKTNAAAALGGSPVTIEAGDERGAAPVASGNSNRS